MPLTIVTPSPVASLVGLLKGTASSRNPNYAAHAAALLSVWPAAVIASYLTPEAEATLVEGRGIYAIVAQPTPGIGRSGGALMAGHSEIKVYAPWGHQAERGATLARWLIFPPNLRGVGWQAGGCRVVDVLNCSAPAALIDPDTRWPYRSFYADFRYYEVGFA